MTRALQSIRCGPDSSADMEIALSRQAAALGAAFVLGVLLGLMYDFIRPFRRRASSGAALCIDVIYGLCSGCGVFLYVMAAPGGRLGLWELTMSFLGFLAYTWFLSDRVYSLTDGVYGLALRFVAGLKNILKKFRNMTKLYFQNVQK